jgi:hypothetical protein
MKGRISTSRKTEAPEAKARWFQSLSVSERMELLCDYTDLILENRPTVMEDRYAQPAAKNILVLREQ